MPISRLTALLIQSDPGVYCYAYGPKDGKYGFAIETLDETPSGSNRVRTLLTSDLTYTSVDLAKEAGDAVLAEIKKTEITS